MASSACGRAVAAHGMKALNGARVREARMAKRKNFHIKGMEHGAPIPNGTVIGNMVFSSAISGKDAGRNSLGRDRGDCAGR